MAFECGQHAHHTCSQTGIHTHTRTPRAIEEFRGLSARLMCVPPAAYSPRSVLKSMRAAVVRRSMMSIHIMIMPGIRRGNIHTHTLSLSHPCMTSHTRAYECTRNGLLTSHLCQKSLAVTGRGENALLHRCHFASQNAKKVILMLQQEFIFL